MKIVRILHEVCMLQNFAFVRNCRCTMSELFMECVEEELEPWQKQAPQIHLIEDDDEPIFVGVLCKLFYISVMFHVHWATYSLVFIFLLSKL